MESKRSLSIRLVGGLILSLTALTVYAAYTGTQLRLLRRMQTEIIDRNRRDSLLLVRMQNDLNTLGLAMRDMLDAKDGYPLTAWRSQFQRIRTDLDDATAALLTLSAANWATTWLRPDADTDELADRFTALLLDGMRGYASRP